MNCPTGFPTHLVVVSALSLFFPLAGYAADTANMAVGPQYDTTHVYVEHGKMDAFVNSILKTFGGTTTKRVLVDVTPTPSKTFSQLILTPSGSFSVFDFQTPQPYPFGLERNGYLVKSMDEAMAQAKKTGADIIVEPFDDPIGKDAVVQWPGGINMQLYWHTTAPNYKALDYIPENRVYVSSYRINDFIKTFNAFSHGSVESDSKVNDAVIGGNNNGTVRQVVLKSQFGKMRVFSTDGHLNWPFGIERTGYGVSDLAATLDKASAAGAKILWHSNAAVKQPGAIVEFPGGYIAEIHQASH